PQGHGGVFVSGQGQLGMVQLTLSGDKYSTVSLWAGLLLIGVSIFFFLESISLISLGTAVVAGLLAAVIGFVMLSSGASLIRTYVLARIAEQQREQPESPPPSASKQSTS
ncbi:MAG TPA: hypothetical protein VE177_00350, partial [Candidatus Binatus sp.]|nr:hypothetical protein [Candidatus Binatus sp.]